MKETSDKYLIVALLIGIVFHGTTMFFTLEKSYDALVHLFFAEHYASHWFASWSFKWYTGFSVMGYPPLVHQLMAVFSFLGGLKFAMFVVALLAVIIFITGVYRFTLLLMGSKKVAGYACVLAVFSSSFLEALHIFGQLPSIIGIALLLHTLPEIYKWLQTGNYRFLFTSLSLLSITVSSHHVTTIFGLVFFVLPVVVQVSFDFYSRLDATFSLNKKIKITFLHYYKRLLLFTFFALLLIIVCILPYWLNIKDNPITQVPIPHGSRDDFLSVYSSGLVFFLVPWGVLLFFFPLLFYRFFNKRHFSFGLSFVLLALLGTGGTTPLPELILGKTAFEILTLDRFTFWATVLALPMFGELIFSFVEGDLKSKIQTKIGPVFHRVLGALIAIAFLFVAGFTISFGYFRPMQPAKIKMLPIVNFLNQDQHSQWRYLPLGFGDQMAWLSTQTNAMTVDGNYHSARRLPELTTRAVERLENAKYRGVEGIGSLQQFLTVPEKYHLKFIFSNDKFYDPMLYFSGWQRLSLLENGISVWEKINIPPMPKIRYKKHVALGLKLLWGIVPLLCLMIAIALNFHLAWSSLFKPYKTVLLFNDSQGIPLYSSVIIKFSKVWILIFLLLIGKVIYSIYLTQSVHISPENVITSYYDALDMKEFERAHSYLLPNYIKRDAFMLQLSVKDGVINSYAKLESMKVVTEKRSDSTAEVSVLSTWITAIEQSEYTESFRVVKKDRKWYVVPNQKNTDLAPEQLMQSNSTHYFNHGRRRITTQQTHHEDILKRPVLEVLSARLICVEGVYSVIGEIQNIDNVPADIDVKATLYDQLNKQLASYNAQYTIKHCLMPKEITSFRVDFEGVAWLNKDALKPSTFNPAEFTSANFTAVPTNFSLSCMGNVLTRNLYKKVALSNVSYYNGKIRGELFNYGLKEVTIPQLIVSYYDAENELIWVDHQFLKNGIRVQKKRSFEYVLAGVGNVEVINSDLKNCFVNNLPNAEISAQILPQRNQLYQSKNKQTFSDAKGTYTVKIEMDNFLGQIME